MSKFVLRNTKQVTEFEKRKKKHLPELTRLRVEEKMNLKQMADATNLPQNFIKKVLEREGLYEAKTRGW